MTFRQFAFNNVLRNKRLYIAYFFSSMFTVMVFFTFAIFAFHPAFSGGSVNETALYGMAVSGGIIYVFSFFFVLYSMSSFFTVAEKGIWFINHSRGLEQANPPDGLFRKYFNWLFCYRWGNHHRFDICKSDSLNRGECINH